MKKLLVFALGLGIALGTVSPSRFAQDTTDTTKKMSKKKTKKKTTDTTSTTKLVSLGWSPREIGWPALPLLASSPLLTPHKHLPYVDGSVQTHLVISSFARGIEALRQ